jgi:pimeloyl-ACP methyl ester carboxylesterase
MRRRPSREAHPARRVGGRSSAVVIVAGTLALAACTSASTAHPGGAAAEPTSDAPAGLADFYAQRLDWSACGEAAECARLDVPLDYDDPAAERITLAVKRVTAEDTGARIGSLVLNFGGPGAPGVDFVEMFADQILSPGLARSYDVVSFDPRGVGASTPVDCVDDAGVDVIRSSDYDRSTESGLAAYTAAARAFAEACAQHTGPLLGEVDTVSAARDLDVLRAVLGDQKLTYFGYSYGTFLGATYAQHFPERTGRLVLDGALDPSLSYPEVAEANAAGLERAVRGYAEACLTAPDCPLSGTVDEAVGQIQVMLDTAEASPLPTDDGRLLTRKLATTGVILALYDQQLWPMLNNALRLAIEKNDGSELISLADAGAQRQGDDGSYPNNFVEVQMAINCLDFPMDFTAAEVAAEAARLLRVSPTFGEYLGYGETICQVWPHQAQRERQPLTAPGAAPILVVGTTGDPATPYAWSQALADQLQSGHLLTWKGVGHTAYGRSNDCIRDAVDTYLLDGALPEEGTTC